MDLKSQLINQYLAQQMNESTGGAKEYAHASQSQQLIEMPDAQALEEFKTHVRTYISADNDIRKLRTLIKERNKTKLGLTSKILSFMARYNIEDLNTKEGKLRYKVTTVKQALNKEQMKSKLDECFNEVKDVEELKDKVFGTKTEVTKHTLKRICPTTKAPKANVTN